MKNHRLGSLHVVAIDNMPMTAKKKTETRTPRRQMLSAHLVVDNDMDGASDRVVGQGTHVQGLVHHPLPSKGAISMHEDAHVLGPLPILGVVLLGTHLAQHNGVHSLQGQARFRSGCM